MHGYHLSGYVTLWGWGTNGGTSAYWAVKHETIALSTILHLLSIGRPRDVERSGWVMAPQRFLCRPSASDLATANSTCQRFPGILPPAAENWLVAIGTSPRKKSKKIR